MYALTMTTSGPRVDPDYPSPSGGAHTAIVALTAAGICATDLEITRGYADFIGVMGHEWVGVVQDCDDPSWIGSRVVGSINTGCGECSVCQGGQPHHCSARTVLGIRGQDGAFAEHFAVPIANLHRVPDNLSDERAVFAEPLAAALEILQQVHIRPGSTVIVLGVGRLGQLCCRVLALTGAHVYGVGRSRLRLDRLPTGVQAVDDPSVLPPADVVVDCTGSPQGLGLATEHVRPGGTIVLKTTTQETSAPTANPWVLSEVTIVGSRCGPFEPALRLMASGVVDPSPLITARFPLSRGLDALAAAAAREHIKVLILPDSPS